MLQQKCFFSHKNDVQSVAIGDNGTLKLDYASATFVDPAV